MTRKRKETIMEIVKPEYEDYVLVFLANNQGFIGKLEEECNRTEMIISEVAQISHGPQGLGVGIPIFPCERMYLNPVFFIRIGDLEKKSRDLMYSALQQYYAQKSSGLILARGPMKG